MSAIPLPQIEGKYEILEKLREGGMGAIYRVRHRLLDEVRVIKLMRPQFTEDEELKERFLREARLAIKLRHPNIAQLYDFTIDGQSGIAFIVMEFIRGTTLEDLLALHGPPPLGLALEIAQQSLRALGYLHTKGFVHRDISPDNLMLTEDAEGGPAVKLIDLGIAKILGAPGEKNLTHTGTFLGKVRYASPEQFGAEGATQVDIRGDLYSFGLVLYELLTGRYPIQGRDPSSIMAGHLFRPPVDFSESDPGERVPDGLRTVVLKALAKHPADRYATALEMSRALAPFRQPEDVSEADLQRVLSAPAAPGGGEPAPVPPIPGSTQQRLDEQFGLGLTPQPRAVEAVTDMAAVEAAAATIELQLQKGSLLEAETGLQWAVDTFGEKPELRTLRDRLEGQRQRETELAAEALVREAQERCAAGDLEGARERLLRAQSLDPGHVEIADLLGQIDQAERRRQEEARREQDVAEALARIEAALERGQAAEAEALLFEAEAAQGRLEVFAALYERLEDLRRREIRARAATHLESARQLLLAGQLDEAGAELQRARRLDPESGEAATLETTLVEARRRKALAEEVAQRLAAARELAAREDFKAALREVRQASKADPENPGPPAVLAEIESAQKRREEEKRRAERIARAAAAIDKKLQRGDLDAADKLLTEEEAAEGSAPELADLRQKLIEARRLEALRQAEREREARERREREEKRAAEAAAAAEAERQRREEERKRQEEERKRQQEERKCEEERKAAAAKIPAPPPVPESTPEPVTLPPPQTTSVTGRRLPWIGIAVAVFALAVLLGWWLIRPADRQEPPAQTVQETERRPPAATATGVLIVDAVPWGEVVTIVDANGAQQPLGAQRTTPLILNLPPGRYTVTLRNPHFPQPASLTAEVLAGAEVRSVTEIGRVTEEELFRALGW